MTASDSGVKTGDVVAGKYVLRACIGRGGMGSVFLADQPALKRKVAVKVLHPELAGSVMHTHRIRNEAITACHAKSPHSVGVIECCALPCGGWALVMEHVPGRSLGRVIAEEPLAPDRLLRLFEQILSALGAVHASGLVHGDVKSDNFLVESVDGSDHLTMIDFGLARVPGSHAWLDLEGDDISVSGTPEYMAPEIACGDPAMPSSDLYAAGVILYELLTGSPPFAADTAMEVILRHTCDAVVPPSLRRPDREFSSAVDRVVLRALDKRPELRFPNAAAFARELRAAMTIAAPVMATAASRANRSSRAPTVRNGESSPQRHFARGSTGGDALVPQDSAFTCDEETGRARPTHAHGSRFAGSCSAPYALFELHGGAPGSPEYMADPVGDQAIELLPDPRRGRQHESSTSAAS